MIKKIIKVVSVLSLITAAVVISPAFSYSYELRINCGGGSYTALNGELYIADREYTPANKAGYVGGAASSAGVPIGGTEDDILYQSDRWGNFGYKLDLPNGPYKVTLRFAEIYFSGVNKRVFDVSLEDRLVLDDFDIYALAGKFNALDREFIIVVSDGQLNITTSAGIDFPKFSAISVVTAEPDDIPPAIPANLSAAAGDKDVFLNWDENTEADFSGYNVYRSTSPGTGYILVNAKILRPSKYLDNDVLNGTAYYYIVRALDIFNNESGNSNEVNASPASKGYFDIPDCAWKRVIGDIPSKTQSSCPDRGVALGGFGAGSFMYSISGAFGPWAMDIGEYHQIWLWEGAFHIYEKKGEGPAMVKCLSTNKNIKSAWNKIEMGDGRYYALQPKGWSTYNCFAADVSQKFFSPIIAHNYKETSYPVATWQFKFSNPTSQNLELAVMFTWPNAPFSDQTRTGLSSSLKGLANITGVVLKAANPSNTPETQNSEWCIATKADIGATVSYVTSWNKDGSGSDIWNDFADDGLLGNVGLDISRSAAAIAVKINLAPGESRIVPLVLSWDFPVTKFKNAAGDGTEWWKKYCEYFGRDSDNSFEIAAEALNNYTQWEAKVDEWMNPVIGSDIYPQWLKTAAFNELYYSQFGGVFYESGLKSGHPQEYMGLHEEDHKFFVMESMTYRYANTFDVRHYSSIIYAKLWPEIERDVLKCFADAIEYYDPILHQTPHDVGNPTADPYFEWDAYGTNDFHWKDLHSKFIQQCWRYYYLYKDKDFLDYVWPACKDTYGYMKTTDDDSDLPNGAKDYLPDNYGSDNTYDSWGLWGTSLLCGGLWVGALEAMEQMAIVQNDPILNEVKTWLYGPNGSSGAKDNLNGILWYEYEPGKGYYKIDTKSQFPTAIMADGLNGQRYCEFYGLDNILPKERIKSHLQEVYKRNVVPLADFNGDGIGDCGAINGIKEDGSLVGSAQQAEEIWTGSTYFLAAGMYHAGLKEEALKTAFGIYYLTYEEESTAYWFNTPEAWHDKGLAPRPANPEQYQRPRAVWELIFEIATGTISGKVTLQGRTNHSAPVTFELRNQGQTTPIRTYSITTASDGSYSISDITPGTYDLTAKSKNTLRNKKASISVVDGQTIANINFSLLGGDCDNNNVVSAMDVAILRAALGTKAGDLKWDDRADFNGNNQIDAMDVAILRSNLGKSGAQ